MNNINLLIFIFFVIGVATGMIVAGLYNIYEFNKAHKELIELKTSCECIDTFDKNPFNFSLGINITDEVD